MEFSLNIGLEVHVQLATRSKMFCRCSSQFGRPANTQVCPVCLGLPGALPVVNRRALELAIHTGLALGCQIASHTRFDRKNYFYPDQPKGYQITQHDLPICYDGELSLPLSPAKKIRITRAHLEEDAGKLIHDEATANRSHVDLNRAGVPLLEIVSAPDLSSPEEAYVYLRELKTILCYLEASDCNMEEGSLRCDANISLRPCDQKTPGTRSEIKNINSFNFLRRALAYEAERQAQILRSGGTIQQATYTWDERLQKTTLMRSKEDSPDYRYFAEPDLSPIDISDDWIVQIRANLPELPRARWQRLRTQYNLDDDDQIFVQDRDEADYFEQGLRQYDNPREFANWCKGQVRAYLNETGKTIGEFPITPTQLVELLRLVDQQTINRDAARRIFAKMAESGRSARDFLDQYRQIDEAEVVAMCRHVIGEYPHLVESYAKKPKALNALVGQVMKKSQGRADVQKVRRILVDLL